MQNEIVRYKLNEDRLCSSFSSSSFQLALQLHNKRTGFNSMRFFNICMMKVEYILLYPV